MSKVINITDKLNLVKPQIQIGDKLYAVDNSVAAVFRFEESITSDGTQETMLNTLTIALGKKAVQEIDITKFSMENYKILVTAIIAAMQNIEYEEAAARFQESE